MSVASPTVNEENKVPNTPLTPQQPLPGNPFPGPSSSLGSPPAEADPHDPDEDEILDDDADSDEEYDEETELPVKRVD